MRNIYIALLVTVGILFPGAVIFRHRESASQAVLVLAFGAGLVVLQVLDRRQRRREGRE